MTTFIHVVGSQGVGKSTLIRALASDYAARGRSCAGQDPDVFNSRDEALAARPGADCYFIEHAEDGVIDAQPGDLVIKMERTAAGAARA